MTKKLVTPRRRSRILWPRHPDPDQNGHPTRRIRTAPLTPSFAVGGPGPYRLARTDSRNISLQRRQPGGNWRTVAYCGNSPAAVTRVVTELAAQHWTPADGDTLGLGRQLDDLRRAIQSLETTIRELL